MIEVYERHISERWCRSAIELLRRLELDWSSIVKHLDLIERDALAGVSPPLGDIHTGGRAVCQLTFASAQKLIYKPRPIWPEHIFGRIVDWLNAHQAFTPPLHHCRVLPREHYGWCEFIARRPCEDGAGVTTFYRRQGAFTCLFDILCGSDCLRDNVVASGDAPVWIDTEAICLPQLDVAPDNLPGWVAESVLNTAMMRPGCGLSVCCVDDRSTIFSPEGVLKDQYIKTVIAGYADLYRWIERHQEEWRSPDGPIGWWRDQRVRVAVRGTSFYASLVSPLVLAALNQRRDIATSIERALQNTNRFTTCPPGLIEAEIATLSDGDIPLWSALTDSRSILDSYDRVFDNVVTLTGLERLTRRVARMGDDDLRRQSWLIDAFVRRRVA